MSFINWSEAFSTNDAELDSQHKKLAVLINEIFNSMAEGKDPDEITKIFTELKDYALFHFLYEEKVMKQLSYSDLETHKKEHDDLANQIKDLHANFLDGHLIATAPLMQFLKKWLNIHMVTADKKLGEFIEQIKK